MSVTNKDLAEQLNRYMLSPIEMQAVASDMIRLASDGELTLVDPSCPFVYLLEVATATAANRTHEMSPVFANCIRSLQPTGASFIVGCMMNRTSDVSQCRVKRKSFIR